jgi:hypothetical protein
VRGEREGSPQASGSVLIKQEGKTVVRGPGKWPCKLSEVLLGVRLECTRKSDGTAGLGVWSSAGQEEGLNLLPRKNN